MTLEARTNTALQRPPVARQGELPKRLVAAHLYCHACLQFRESDPDVFDCALHQPEFPGLCASYHPKNQP